MCHHNSFLIYESLVDANAKRWNIVTHVSVLFSMACSLVLGVTGYATFTGYTQGKCATPATNDPDLLAYLLPPRKTISIQHAPAALPPTWVSVY